MSREGAIHSNAGSGGLTGQRQCGISRGQADLAQALSYPGSHVERNLLGHKARRAQSQRVAAREYFNDAVVDVHGCVVDRYRDFRWDAGELDVRPIGRQRNLERLALVSARDLDRALPYLISRQAQGESIGTRLKHLIEEWRRSKRDRIEPDLGPCGLRAQREGTGQRRQPNVQLLGIGLAHNDRLLKRMVALGSHRQIVLTRANQQALAKWQMPARQRIGGIPLCRDVER